MPPAGDGRTPAQRLWDAQQEAARWRRVAERCEAEAQELRAKLKAERRLQKWLKKIPAGRALLRLYFNQPARARTSAEGPPPPGLGPSPES